MIDNAAVFCADYSKFNFFKFSIEDWDLDANGQPKNMIVQGYFYYEEDEEEYDDYYYEEDEF